MHRSGRDGFTVPRSYRSRRIKKLMTTKIKKLALSFHAESKSNLAHLGHYYIRIFCVCENATAIIFYYIISIQILKLRMSNQGVKYYD